MKFFKLSLALAMFSSATALACPNLAGSYTCLVNGEEQETVISIEKRGNVTIYRVNNGAIVADNKVYKIPDSDGLKKGTVRSWCQGTTELKSELKGKLYDQGRFVGDLNAIMTAALDQDSALVQTVKGKVVAGGKNYPVDQTVSCRRNIKR